MRTLLGVSICLVIAIFGLSCRTQWRHPDATAEKYSHDTFFCQYGIERSEWEAQQREQGVSKTESDRSWALSDDSLPAGGVRPDWKHCMIKLGWESVQQGSGDARWRVTPDS